MLGAISGFAAMAIAVLILYLLILAILLPFFVFRISQDVGDIRDYIAKATLGQQAAQINAGQVALHAAKAEAAKNVQRKAIIGIAVFLFVCLAASLIVAAKS